MISICKKQIEGLKSRNTFIIFTPRCPLKVQISQGLGHFFQIGLLKTGRKRTCLPRLRPSSLPKGAWRRCRRSWRRSATLAISHMGKTIRRVCQLCYPTALKYDQIIRQIRISWILALARPRMQAAGLQCLKLQVAVASPGPQTRAFPGTELSWNIRSPNHQRRNSIIVCHVYYMIV